MIRLRLKPEVFFGHSCYYKENFQTFKRRTVKSGYTKLARKKEKTFSEGENVGQGEIYRERVVEREERERRGRKGGKGGEGRERNGKWGRGRKHPP